MKRRSLVALLWLAAAAPAETRKLVISDIAKRKAVIERAKIPRR